MLSSDVILQDERLLEDLTQNNTLYVNVLDDFNSSNNSMSDTLIAEVDASVNIKKLTVAMGAYKNILLVFNKDALIQYKTIVCDRKIHFIVKPYEANELSVRLQKFLAQEEQDRIVYRDITLLNNKRKVYVNDVLINLSHLEYDLLYYFIKNKEALLTKNDLIRNVWQSDAETFKQDKLRVAIFRLKNKLKTCNVDEYIQARTGFGYYLQ